MAAAWEQDWESFLFVVEVLTNGTLNLLKLKLSRWFLSVFKVQHNFQNRLIQDTIININYWPMMRLTRRSFSSRPSSGIQDLINNYESVPSPSQRFGLLLKASFGALADPKRADLVSVVGDLSSSHALHNMHLKMLSNTTGRQILQDKPRVTSETWNL